MTRGCPKIDEATIARVSVSLAMFHRGPGCKGTKADIAQAAQTIPRKVELAINRLRRRGYPICSDGSGYWLAEDPRELDHPIRSMTHRIREIVLTRDALVRTKDRMMAGQMLEPNGQRRIF